MSVDQETPPVRFVPPKTAASPINEPWYNPPGAAMMGRGKVTLAALLGVGTLLAGAWAAIVSLLAPSYGFPIDSVGAWHVTAHRLILHVVPGGVAVIGGLVLLIALPALRHGKGRIAGGLAALVVMSSGAWLLLGRSALAAITGSTVIDSVGGSPSWAFLLRVAHEWGPGLLLLAFGAWSLGLQAVGKTRAK
jgi:hypothetical protein